MIGLHGGYRPVTGCRDDLPQRGIAHVTGSEPRDGRFHIWARNHVTLLVEDARSLEIFGIGEEAHIDEHS